MLSQNFFSKYQEYYFSSANTKSTLCVQINRAIQFQRPDCCSGWRIGLHSSTKEMFHCRRAGNSLRNAVHKEMQGPRTSSMVWLVWRSLNCSVVVLNVECVETVRNCWSGVHVWCSQLNNSKARKLEEWITKSKHRYRIQGCAEWNRHRLSVSWEPNYQRHHGSPST